MSLVDHLWLFANPESKLHSFEKDIHWQAVGQLRHTFGEGRLHMHAGSTRLELPRFESPDGLCDIVSIDAGHDGWDPYDDLVDLLPNTKCNATVFFDDTFDDRTVGKPINNDPWSAAYYNYCTRSYWRAVREGLLKHTFCESRPKRAGKLPKGYCMGQAAAPSLCSPRRRPHELSHAMRDAPPTPVREHEHTAPKLLGRRALGDAAVATGASGTITPAASSVS